MGQVIIDRLGYPDGTNLVSAFGSFLMHFIGGVLRVIASGIEKITDIVCLNYLEETLHIFLRLFNVFLEIDFVSACAQCSSRSVFQALDGSCVFLTDIDKLFAKDAIHAVESAVDFLNTLVPSGFTDDARNAGIDDSSWATALCD